MIRRCLIALLLLAPLLLHSQSTATHRNPASFHVYDPGRDAGKDIQQAIAEAGRTNKHVLMEIGGNWCSWCRYFEEFYATHPDLRELRDRNYVMVRVNFSEENKNEAVIGKYGKVTGYPHIFILDGDGKLLHSEDTSELEQGQGYSESAMRAFLDKWAPKP